jgi:membrane protein DedA with SNARE-associated domain
VVFARFFNVLRQLNGIVAGTLGMNWRRFLLCNMVGGALWVAVWVFGPLYVSEHIPIIIRLAHHTEVVVGALLGIVLIFVVALVLRRRRNRAVPFKRVARDK